MKQVIVVRKDLGMRKGKMIAQGCHASLGAYFESLDQRGDHDVAEWECTGATKIVVGVSSITDLFEVYNNANAANIPCYIVKDAGRTEFKEPTYTALAIGPFDDEEIDKITGSLLLL